jgi:hypothetical protein
MITRAQPSPLNFIKADNGNHLFFLLNYYALSLGPNHLQNRYACIIIFETLRFLLSGARNVFE